MKSEATIRKKCQIRLFVLEKPWNSYNYERKQLKCAEYGLQIWLSPTEARRDLTLDIQPISDEYCLENFTWYNEICVFS